MRLGHSAVPYANAVQRQHVLRGSVNIKMLWLSDGPGPFDSPRLFPPRNPYLHPLPDVLPLLHVCLVLEHLSRVGATYLLHV